MGFPAPCFGMLKTPKVSQVILWSLKQVIRFESPFVWPQRLGFFWVKKAPQLCFVLKHSRVPKLLDGRGINYDISTNRF